MSAQNVPAPWCTAPPPSSGAPGGQSPQTLIINNKKTIKMLREVNVILSKDSFE